MSSFVNAYYRDRALAERARALSADRQDVAAIHDDLATLYQALIDRDEARPALRMANDNQLNAPA